ncbi:MAG: acetylglutamate kinase [Phycisphaeraceae bacterium]|nr:acetylglutamate kinase [Phycisphaeraceae bacterium]
MTRNPTNPSPLIVKLGGDAIDAPTLPNLCTALAELHAALPAGIVIVHGGGKAVDRQLDRLALTSERRDGLRITPPPLMEQVTAILAGVINTTLVGALTAQGVPAVGLTLGDGLLSVCEPLALDFDPGRVGDVARGDPLLLTTLLDAAFLPVLSCVGLDAAGQTLNVNADHAARSIARLTNASGLLLLTDAKGILGPDQQPIAQITRPAIEDLIASGVITAGMIPKARAAADAADAAGVPATIASWKAPADLLALIHNQPLGTRVLPSVPAEPATARRR